MSSSFNDIPNETSSWSYLSSCQSLFEPILSHLALSRPEDPIAESIKQLQSLSEIQKEKILSGFKPHSTQINQSNPIHIILTLTPNITPNSHENRSKIIELLKELKHEAKYNHSACELYEILINEIDNQVTVHMKWLTQQGLDQYYSSKPFLSASIKFQGLLACTPQEKLCTSVI